MHLNKFEKIIIKIGSSNVIDKYGKPNKKWLKSFADDVKFLLTKKKKVLIVSSGAIGFGCSYLKLEKKKLKLDQNQAVASLGQIELMDFYKNIFNKKKMKVAQILLTLEDTEQRRRALNARRTLDNLLKMKIVPIINENDTTATTEIKYGDNDRLSSRVAQIMGCDCLIILTDIDGLYTKNPKKNSKGKLLNSVTNINKEIENYADNSNNTYGSGGMKTKIDAAKICMSAGCHMIITNGNFNNPIKKLIKENKATWFIPKISKLDARKRWIIGSIAPKGEIIIDEGAIRAIISGKSLLPAGIKKVIGKFNKGDNIIIRSFNENEKEFARGLCSFSSEEIEKIKGMHSSKIEKILGYSSKDEVVHRDDLVKI